MQPVYDLLALAIFAMMIVLLFRSFRPAKDQTRDLEDWMAEQLDEQADAFERMLQASQDALSKQNYAAIRGVKDAVDGMGMQLTGSQSAQQKNLEGRFQTMEKTLESRLRTMELSNAQRLEEMRRTLTEGMDTVRAENAKKLDEIRRTVDEQLQDTPAEAGERELQDGERPAGTGLQGAGRDAVPGRRCGRAETGAVGGQDPGHPWGDPAGGHPGGRSWPPSSTTPTWPPSPAPASGWSSR